MEDEKRGQMTIPPTEEAPTERRRFPEVVREYSPRFETLEDIRAYTGQSMDNLVGRTVGLKSRSGKSGRMVAVCELVGFREVPELGWVACVRHSRCIARRPFEVEIIDCAVDQISFDYE